jgi:hypothetical protein
MRGAIPPLPQYAFMAWCSEKCRDNFTFTFIGNKSRDSSVGIALGYGLDDRGSRVRFAVKKYWGSGGIAPSVNLGARRR